jgi:hypothetical protein
MLIAKYLISDKLHKVVRNGKTYYKIDSLSCGSGFYADNDEQAIEVFAKWCNVPTNCIRRVA